MNVVNYVIFAAVLLVCGAAAIRGRWPERVAAGALVLNIVSNFLAVGEGGVPPSPNTALANDMILMTILGVVAVRARPPWTLFAAAFQLLATLTSVVNYLAGGMDYRVFATAQNTLFLMTLSALAYGVWRSWGTARRSAAHPS